METKRESYAEKYIMEALVLLMERKEYKDISITEICRKAGVTRMSFYRNFVDKEDILRKWVVSVTNGFLEESRISYKNDSTKDYFVKLFTHMQDYLKPCLAIYKSGLMYIVKEEFDRVFLAVHEGEYDAYKSYFLAGGIYNVFLLWLKNGCKETPEELAVRMEDMLQK